MYYKVIKHRDLNGPLYCELTSAIFASAYVDLVGTTYIIDTNLHSVVSEGEHTWDLNNGIVFYNYIYPSLSPPKFTKIPKFAEFFDQKGFDMFYSSQSLAKSQPTVSVKKVEYTQWPLRKRKKVQHLQTQNSTQE